MSEVLMYDLDRKAILWKIVYYPGNGGTVYFVCNQYGVFQETEDYNFAKAAYEAIEVV